MGLMNALRNLFGAGGTRGEATAAAVDYQGYRITPAPQRQPSGWNTAGVITKAQQIIDEQGDRIFRNA